MEIDKDIEESLINIENSYQAVKELNEINEVILKKKKYEDMSIFAKLRFDRMVHELFPIKEKCINLKKGEIK